MKTQGKFLVKTFRFGSKTVNLREEMLCPEPSDIFPQFNKHLNNAGRGMREKNANTRQTIPWNF